MERLKKKNPAVAGSLEKALGACLTRLYSPGIRKEAFWNVANWLPVLAGAFHDHMRDLTLREAIAERQ